MILVLKKQKQRGNLLDPDYSYTPRHINIPVYELLDGNIKKNNYNSKKEKFSIYLKAQLVLPDIQPFTDYKIEYDTINIKFLDGENLNSGDIYCRSKLTDDIEWKRTKTINKCQNPQWYDNIILPITNESNQVEIEIKNDNILVDTTFGSFKLNINDISTKTKKQTYIVR